MPKGKNYIAFGVVLHCERLHNQTLTFSLLTHKFTAGTKTANPLKGNVMNLLRSLVGVMALCTITMFTARTQSLPWSDNFDYTAGTNLKDATAWEQNSSGNNIKITSGGLSYTNYPGSGVGNAVDVKPGQESVFRAFNTQSAGANIYVSFMVKVSAAKKATNGEVFLYLRDLVDGFPAGAAAGYVYLRDNSDGWRYGISVVNESPTFKSTSYSSSETQLIVIKYSLVSGNFNDQMKLWVNPDLSGSEPAADVSITQPGAAVDQEPDTIEAVEIRELASADSATLHLDGLRVSNSWSDAPLPVQLVAFTATANRLAAELRWSTATETNNYGFEIERRRVESSTSNLNPEPWRRVGFVPGAGTSTSPQEYSFVDAGLSPGRYAYRIKQVDNDGAFTYFSGSEVEIGAAPKEFTLHPNYPNPFNPSTSIEFTIPEDGFVSLKVYNLLGQEVAVLFEGEAVGGRIYQQTFDASQLPTGVYVSRLSYGGQSLIQKMVLAK
jgi:hypothetical protein